ncbi:hypothetical protein GP2143_06869, partial [marine gamma proteobacterium HTCC2143]
MKEYKELHTLECTQNAAQQPETNTIQPFVA